MFTINDKNPNSSKAYQKMSISPGSTPYCLCEFGVVVAKPGIFPLNKRNAACSIPGIYLDPGERQRI
jgi:hypothetical protein